MRRDPTSRWGAEQDRLRKNSSRILANDCLTSSGGEARLVVRGQIVAADRPQDRPEREPPPKEGVTPASLPMKRPF